jgi:hypothetical protein
MNRKEFLAGAAGLAVGTPLGAIAAWEARRPKPAPKCPPHGHISYAQAGEDLIAAYFFAHFKITDVTYLDIGAYDPILINNTYFFYTHGLQGVLVEPNVDMTVKLRAVRPRDVVLEAGIGIGKTGVADYYVMSEPDWSTFDKAEADHQGKAPTFVSSDAEGWHFAILKSIDFARFRPAVICVETLVSAESRTIPEIPAFMATQGYDARGGSFVNTIFVDAKLLS